MSYPIYKDLDKSVTGKLLHLFLLFCLANFFIYSKYIDILNDDFDTKYVLKVKSPGPFGLVSSILDYS